MAKCEFQVCTEEATVNRTVNGPHGHSWTANLCNAHASQLDQGMPMTVYVFAMQIATKERPL